MPRALSHFLIVVAAMWSTAFPLAAAETAKDKAKDEIVRMAPFKVRESNGAFELEVKVDPKTQYVQEIRVSWLSDMAKKARLERGDILVAIDDQPVAGRPVEDIFALKEVQEPPGTTHRLAFTGSGWSGSSRRITWTCRGLRAGMELKTEAGEPLAKRLLAFLESIDKTIVPKLKSGKTRFTFVLSHFQRTELERFAAEDRAHTYIEVSPDKTAVMGEVDFTLKPALVLEVDGDLRAPSGGRTRKLRRQIGYPEDGARRSPSTPISSPPMGRIECRLPGAANPGS
jgi:hypothetical protein